jgi:hypothetical protein
VVDRSNRSAVESVLSVVSQPDSNSNTSAEKMRTHRMSESPSGLLNHGVEIVQKYEGKMKR